MQSSGEVAYPSGGKHAVIADTPAALALGAAMMRSAAGLPFRIGGGAETPATGSQPMFETLTSGTSGAPRRIWRTQASWTVSFAENARLFGIGPGCKVAVVGGLSHSLALYGALEALHLGATLYLLGDLRSDRQRKVLATSDVTVLYATPAQARQIVGNAGPALPALRVILIGGSKLDMPLRTQLAETAPNAQICEFYGAAETSFLTLARPGDPPASVGRPYPQVRLDILDDHGQGMPAGQTGEVWAKSPYLFSGYGGALGSAHAQDGWVSVGEIGYLADGALYLVGRKTRIVQIADQSVYLDQMEAFMAELSGIQCVAILPIADAKRSTVLIAVAMGNPALADPILAAMRKEYGPLKAPRRIVWRESWPQLASGKTDLSALQRELG